MVIVDSMMSFPTQTDEEELKNMDPIVPRTTKQETTDSPQEEAIYGNVQASVEIVILPKESLENSVSADMKPDVNFENTSTEGDKHKHCTLQQAHFECYEIFGS